jgi:hypothetical protein
MIGPRRILLVLSVAAIGIGGCGSSAPVPTPTAETSASTSSASSTTSENIATSSATSTQSSEPGESLHYVGTVTMNGGGTKVTEAVSLGTLGYGQEAAPPQQVLEASNSDYTTTIATSAYVSGNLKLSYIGGRVPINFTFADVRTLGNLSGGFPTEASAVFDIDGQWTTGGSEGESAVSMNPNETIEIPIWLQIGGAVSNTQASIPQKDFNLMTWELVPYIEQAGPPTAYSGPQAATCNGKHVLLPFAKLPFSHVGNRYAMATNESVHCEALG